jgi:hypothetical protein
MPKAPARLIAPATAKERETKRLSEIPGVDAEALFGTVTLPIERGSLADMGVSAPA